MNYVPVCSTSSEYDTCIAWEGVNVIVPGTAVGSEKALAERAGVHQQSKRSQANEIQLAPERLALTRGCTDLPCTLRGSSPLIRLGTDDMDVFPR